MKALAQYVMTGPKQASIFCLGFGFVPVIGPWLCVAALGLVVLQLGVSSAIKVLPWAVIPGVVWLAIGDPSLILLLLTVFLSAVVLEKSRSLGLALVVSVCISAAVFVLGQNIMLAQVNQLAKVMNQVLNASPEMQRLIDDQSAEKPLMGSANGKSPTNESISLEALLVPAAEESKAYAEVQEASTESEVALEVEATSEKVSPVQFEGMVTKLTKMALAFASGFTACLVLLIARWWQSLLYKPGAFQTEFHALRLTRNQILILCLMLVVLVLGLDSVSEDKLGMLVAPLLTIPVLLSGIALVHGLVAIAGVSVHWLGIFYMALAFVGHLVFVPLTVMALLDVVIDFRSRFRRTKDAEKGE